MAIAFGSKGISGGSARMREDPIVATDGELLTQFVQHRDHGSFAQIVERHGRLVWMICRQVLGHHHDVEDAFQATFLILAQQASAIRASDSASAWLYKVAMRTALAARRKRSRRREESLSSDPCADEKTPSVIDDRELLYILVQELRSLPARYQTPLVMRYLEGQSRRAIADQTDSTVAQIQGRLVRGRRMLRSRFLRRGVSLSMATGAVSGTNESASAAVTPALVTQTAENCLAMKTSGDTGEISPLALALFYYGVKAMWMTFIGKCTAVVSAMALAGGIILAAQGEGGRDPAGHKAVSQVELGGGSQKTAEGAVEHGPGGDLVAALADRFKYKVPVEIGQSEFKEGGRIEITEVWGTRPKIEVGGQYLVKGKYVLPPGQRGALYFYETTDGTWGREPTANVDLQTVTLDKSQGEFTLLHGMQGPGRFHLYLASPEKYAHYFANVYFGTGANVLPTKTSSSSDKSSASSTADRNSGPRTAEPSKPMATANDDEVARQHTNYIHELSRKRSDQQDIWGELLKNRAVKSADLEMIQVEKTMLQRELAQAREKLSEEQLAETINAKPEADRSELHKKINHRVSEITSQLQHATARAADLSREQEQLQMDVSRAQRRIDELDRMIIQAELPIDPVRKEVAKP